MEKKAVKKKLSAKQAKVVEDHLHKIHAAHKELQRVLTEFGFEPVGGWSDPTEFQLVKGVQFVNSDAGTCDECSVVCFDSPCGECVECAGDVVNYKNISLSSHPTERVLLEVANGALKVHLKAKAKAK